MDKLYIIAGEASGDLHGSLLARALIQKQPNITIRGWGGQKMKHAGVHISKDLKQLAFMGFAEVISNLGTIMRNFKDCKEDINNFQPDAVVLIDYPGFNLRLAKWLKKNEYRVFYYISPQIWAWKEKRVELVRKYVDKMMVILPFEKAFYAKHGIAVDYVGHPLLEAIEGFQNHAEAKNIEQQKPIILLPGSRKQEIKALLPIMAQVATKFPNERFKVAMAPAMEKSFYSQTLENNAVNIPANLILASETTYKLLLTAKAALVCSGTATLETALFGVPQIVCYKGNRISYWIARRLIKVKYISLVNLILDQPLVLELIQDDCKATSIHVALSNILEKNQEQEKITKGYAKLRQILSGNKKASETAADIILANQP